MNSQATKRGLVFAAPATGSGKTILVAGLLRALRNRGVNVGAAKIGPDYIDPGFHTLASGKECFNLDCHAMRDTSLIYLIDALYQQADIILCEGVMGLFDAAKEGTGSSAECAKKVGWPIILIVSAKGQGESLAALIKGFLTYRSDTDIVGLIINNTSSSSHEELLREVIHREFPTLPLLGFVQKQSSLCVASRHLGLLAKGVTEKFLEDMAAIIEKTVDISALMILAQESSFSKPGLKEALLPLPAKNIAIAKDDAFSFIYSGQLDLWRKQGAVISFFSPLKDETPEASVDMVFLPGGYPELFLPEIVKAQRFKNFLQKFQGPIYGECGGYMVLGRSIVGENGQKYLMADLLDLETSFQAKKRHLGYRHFHSLADIFLGKRGQHFSGHEFHYSAILKEKGEALWQEVSGKKHGLRKGNICGSFFHLIDRQ